MQVSLATLLGADPARAEKEMLEALEFERKLANVTSATKNCSLYFISMTCYNFIFKISSVVFTSPRRKAKRYQTV